MAARLSAAERMLMGGSATTPARVRVGVYRLGKEHGRRGQKPWNPKVWKTVTLARAYSSGYLAGVAGRSRRRKR